MTIETTQQRQTHQKLHCSRGRPRLRLGTWNVRTLNDQPGKEEGKVALLVREVQKHKVDICGLSEVKREGQGATLVEQGHMLIHSGSVKGRAHGVGFCLSPAARAALVQYTCISNRIAYAEFRVEPNLQFVVMQVYAPHSNRPDEESDDFYAHLTAVIGGLQDSLRQNLMVLGDFNAQVCVDQRWGGCVGPFALGRETTANGERMVHLCQQWDMSVKSTFYRHKRNDLYTWYSNANTRSQLDHVLMVRASPIKVMDCRAYRTSMGYLGTDHCLVVCQVRTCFPARHYVPRRPRYNVKLLEDEDVCSQYQREIGEIRVEFGTPNEQWQTLRDGICQAGNNHILVTRQPHTEPWMTTETLQAIDDKGRAWVASKGQDGLGAPEAKARYNVLKNLARRLVRRDKRAYWEAHAKKVEEAFKEHKWHDAYKYLKALGAGQEASVNTIRGPDGNALTSPESIHAAWKEFFELLLNCQREIPEGVYEGLPVHPNTDPLVEHAPIRQEVVWGLQAVLNYKAAGVCDIKGEMLKKGGSNLVTLLHQLITAVWDSGHMPDQWREGIIAPIWKSGDKTDVRNYRGICLQSVAAKVYSNILKNRLRGWAEGALLEVQYGFRDNRGCPDAIFVLRRVIDQHLVRRRPLHICFIDITKAYDSVNRETAWKALLHRGAPPKIVELLRDMHTDTKYAVRAPGLGIGDTFSVETGFKQGDVISPMLFNLYMDCVIREVMPKIKSLGITFRYAINGALHETDSRVLGEEDLLWILLYADDIALMSDDADKLQRMVTALHLAFQRWGLLISVGKTKSMTVYVPRPGEEPPPTPIIYIGDQRIEHVNKFKYLGQIISSDGKLKGEISRRIGQAYAAFRSLEKKGIWKDKLISRRTKLTIYKVTVLTILLYCSETWSIGPKDVKKLETAQMTCLKRICGDKSWGRDSTPYIVIRKNCQTPTIQNLITYHRLRWLGKVCRMQEDRLPIRILFGRSGGQLPRGHPPKTWLEYVKDDLRHLSEIRTRREMRVGWWRLCKDEKEWTKIIKKVVEMHT